LSDSSKRVGYSGVDDKTMFNFQKISSFRINFIAEIK